MSNPFEKALAAIDSAHELDPNKTPVDGKEIPYELLYAQKCTSYLQKRLPDASEALQLAIRAQHFRRWEVPRSNFPQTRIGYHSWRTHLKKRQASLVEEICLKSGYDKEFAERVGSIMRKEDYKSDEEAQVLEDVACLVFLDDQFEAFEKTLDEEKVVTVLRKTWVKMSDKGHELAFGIGMSERSAGLVKKALEG